MEEQASTATAPRAQDRECGPSATRLPLSRQNRTAKAALVPAFKVSHKEIYRHHAAAYELLISRQDHLRNIEGYLRHLNVFVLDTDVLELGAGTGRLTRMVAPWVRSIHAFDSSEHMLSMARERMAAHVKDCGCRWRFSPGNNREPRKLGVQPTSVDVVLAGWTLSYVKAEVWSSLTWDQEVKRVLADLRLLLRPNGHIVILETLGTGNEQPNRRNLLYTLLEEAGFQFKWFRTDYRFDSWEEAIALTRFFFGSKVAGMVEEKRRTEDQSKLVATKENYQEECGEPVTFPECTGLWWAKGEDIQLGTIL